jgi:hypothetical protein
MPCLGPLFEECPHHGALLYTFHLQKSCVYLIVININMFNHFKYLYFFVISFEWVKFLLEIKNKIYMCANMFPLKFVRLCIKSIKKICW